MFSNCLRLNIKRSIHQDLSKRQCPPSLNSFLGIIGAWKSVIFWRSKNEEQDTCWVLRERCKLKVNIPDRNRTWEVWGGWAFWSFSPPFSPALAPRLGWPSSTRGWSSFILKIATIQFNFQDKIVDKMTFYPVESLQMDLMIFFLQQAEDARDLSLPGLVWDQK